MVLFEGADMAATENGEWFAVDADSRVYRGISIQISGGTATVTVEVRNGPDDTPYVVRTLSESEAFMIGVFPQMRVNVTAVGSTPVVRATIDAHLRPAA